jgi:hypothetical protein
MPGSKSSAPTSVHVAPAEPLALTVHSVAMPDLQDPQQAAQQRTRDGRLKMLLVLAVCAAPVIASYFTYFVLRPQGRNNYGELIQPTRSLPEALVMRDLNDKTVLPKSLRGQWLLVSVAGTACDSACDKRLFTQRQLREMLGKERDRVDKVWFITDDKALAQPLRAAVLAAPAVTVLRVDRAALAAWLAPASGATLEDHLYVVDPMGEWMMRLPVNPEPAKVKKDLERLLRASSFWDKAGR